MSSWNAVATVQGNRFREARKLLSEFGRVKRTSFHNLLVMEAADPRSMLATLTERKRTAPAASSCVAHMTPLDRTFSFRSPEEFEQRAREVLTELAPTLAGRAFYVRIHRRGFKQRISSRLEEQLLDQHLLHTLEQAKAPGHIDFDNPDVVVLIEIVGSRAGLSLFRREDRDRYPLLNVD